MALSVCLCLWITSAEHSTENWDWRWHQVSIRDEEEWRRFFFLFTAGARYYRPPCYEIQLRAIRRPISPPPPLFCLPPSKTSWRNYRCKSFPRHGRCEGSLGGEWEGGKEEWEGRRGWNCITQLIGSIYARTSTPEQYCCYSLMHFIFAGIAELTIIYHYLHGLAHNICYSAGARWADWCSTCEILAAI